MLIKYTCTNCGQPVQPDEYRCPNCGSSIRDNSNNVSVSPEMLVYRLGDYLLESEVINQEELQRALDYQKSEAPERHIRLGQALVELGSIDRDTLDKAVAQQLISLHNALELSNRQLEQRIKQRTNDLERRLIQIRTAAEITQLAIFTSNLSDLLNRTIKLIVDRFGYYRASFFLVDSSQEYAILTEVAGPVGHELSEGQFRIKSGSNSLIGWVLANNDLRIIHDVTREQDFPKNEYLPEIISEAGFPIRGGNYLLGVLHVQHTVQDAFDPDAVAILQTIANHLATVIQNVRLLKSAQSSLNEISSLYETSCKMAVAKTPEEVIQLTDSAIKQSPYYSIVLKTERGFMRVVAVNNPTDGGRISPRGDSQDLELITISTEEINKFLPVDIPFKTIDKVPEPDQPSEIPEKLHDVINQLDYHTVSLIPIRQAGNLEMLIIFGIKESKTFPLSTLQYFANLASIASTTLEKICNSQRMSRQISALQSLNTISQAVSAETDMMVLYRVIHQEVVNSIGDMIFAIATYNDSNGMINVPYYYDGQEVKQVDSFPLGEGLTSILIKTKKPLLFVEDVEKKTRELGATFIGAPAKSWLGVPLITVDGVIGAIIVQDTEQEGRFDEDDQRLLTTLASQVAVALRNAHLLEITYRHSERDRLLYKITNEIRNSTDIASILTITTQEISKALGSRRASIELGVDMHVDTQDSQISTDENTTIPDKDRNDEDYPKILSPGEIPEE